MTYDQTLSYLFEQLPMYHRIGPAAYKPGLDNTYALLKLVSDPHKKMRTVHIAGTNGKGSTSHLIASVLQEAGYKTGLYTSPHLKDFRERIRIDGEMIPKDEVVQFVDRYKDQWQEIKPSFFEITVALCFHYFAKEKVDIAVIETGLGGRLDSTNVITPEVSVITNIGMDHMNLLGDTPEKIAFEKAGIIKKNIPVVLGKMRVEALKVMADKALQESTGVTLASDAAWVPDCPLLGIYQQENKQTALAALHVLRQSGRWKISDDDIIRGYKNVITNTGLMGRWQQINTSPKAIAEVAHNEDGIKMLSRQLVKMDYHKLHIVLGVVGDKDVSRVLRILPKDATYYFCSAAIPRALAANELQTLAATEQLFGTAYNSVAEAYKNALQAASADDLILITGSIFTVAEVL